MKDAKDSKTIDILGSKKRGRPATGNAKTAAQRMAEKRERDRAISAAARYQADYEALTTGALIEAIAIAVREKQPTEIRKISQILINRTKA